MGSNLGSVVANTYMNFFEKMAFRSAVSSSVTPPYFWIRYVDDVLGIFHDEEHIQPFLDFINTLRISIQFTLEIEENGALPFLDLLITKSGGSLLFSVYRKPTHTERYLHRRSCHPSSVFKSLVSCLKGRALALCSSSELHHELRYLGKTFTRNGYSDSDIRPLCTTRTSRARTVSVVPTKRVVLPFYPSLAGKLTRILRRAGLTPSFRPQRSLGSLLCRRRPTSIETRGLVYRIPCSQCDWSYVGETGRSLAARLKEHKRAVQNLSTASELVNHMLSADHRIDWEGAAVVCRESVYSKRIFKEAWYTRIHKSSNRVFHDLDVAWGVV